MSRRHRFEPHIKKNSTFVLNITSMTDMFTILLVFLLQTYSTSEFQIIPENGLQLPVSNSQTSPLEGVKITLSMNELKIDKTKIASLNNSDFISEDLQKKDKNFIKPLFAALEKIAQETPDLIYVKEGRILLQADRELPYSVIKKVMYTASMAGFPQLKIITLIGD